MPNQSKIRDPRFWEIWRKAGSVELKVIGYILMNADGDYLAEGLYWYDHSKPVWAFVHSAGDISQIIEKLIKSRPHAPVDLWCPPTKMIPATWSAALGVRLTGKPEDFPWPE